MPKACVELLEQELRFDSAYRLRDGNSERLADVGSFAPEPFFITPSLESRET
jgi:hypothetical protein